jgi:hypothetical protein
MQRILCLKHIVQNARFTDMRELRIYNKQTYMVVIGQVTLRLKSRVLTATT